MKRRFQYQDQEWEVETTGGGGGVALGGPPSITRWTAIFRCLSDSSVPKRIGALPDVDSNKLDVEVLQAALESAKIRSEARTASSRA